MVSGGDGAWSRSEWLKHSGRVSHLGLSSATLKGKHEERDRKIEEKEKERKALV